GACRHRLHVLGQVLIQQVSHDDGVTGEDRGPNPPALQVATVELAVVGDPTTSSVEGIDDGFHLLLVSGSLWVVKQDNVSLSRLATVGNRHDPSPWVLLVKPDAFYVIRNKRLGDQVVYHSRQALVVLDHNHLQVQIWLGFSLNELGELGDAFYKELH